MTDRLAEIEARLSKATPGPWAWEPHGDSGSWSLGVVWDDNDNPLRGRIEPGEGEVVECIAEGGVNCTDADAALIAAAPSDLRDLLAAVKAARDAHESGEIIVTDADTAHAETHLAIPEYAALALRAALANLKGDAT